MSTHEQERNSSSKATIKLEYITRSCSTREKKAIKSSGQAAGKQQKSRMQQEGQTKEQKPRLRLNKCLTLLPVYDSHGQHIQSRYRGGGGEKKNGIDEVTETQKIMSGNKITSLTARQGLPFAPDKLIG